MNEQPLVSIAIPAYRAEFFRSALASTISQDYPNLEIVICDDSSGEEIKAITDQLAQECRSPVRYLRNARHLGFARNLQACLEQCSGQFIKFLCDDDLLLAGCISRQAEVLAECSDVSMVTSQRLLCDADECLMPSRAINCVVSPGNAVMRASDLLEVIASNVANLFGGISHSMFRREQVEEFLAALVQEGQGFAARLDLALYACLLRRGHLACLKDVLSLERVHPGQLSHHASMQLAYKSETDWLSQMLDARAAEPAPAAGWVRYVALDDYRDGEDRVWQEFELQLAYVSQISNYQQRVGLRSLSFADVYTEWLECRSLSSGQLRMLPKRIERWSNRPRIVPVILSHNADERALRTTLDSLAVQSYAPEEIWIFAAAGQSVPEVAGLQVRRETLRGYGFEQINQRLSVGEGGDWIFLLQPGDLLHPHALVVMAERMAVQADRLCLYVDEGAYDGRESSVPVFKPDFNLDLMRSLPYVGRLLGFKCAALVEMGGFVESFESLAPHDLLWRMVEVRGLHVVEHVAELLVQCGHTYEHWMRDPVCVAQAPRVLEAHLQRLGVAAYVQPIEGSPVSRVHYQHEGAPGVSMLVDAGQDLLALIRCVESVFEHTAYSNYEVLIIATDEAPAAMRNWLAAMQQLGSAQLRVVWSDAGSKGGRLNQARALAHGDYLLLLDANCMAFDKQWLDEMMSQAQRPEVAVVGPRLVNSEGGVLSAGLVLGLHGPAGSPFLGHGASTNGYMSRLQLVQNWSAVSLDCLLVRRSVFEELDGLDAALLHSNLFDADLCLRAREQGYLVVWSPFASLVRFPGEVSSLSVQFLEHDEDAFYSRWLSRVAWDPAYNRNLSLTGASFILEPGMRTGWDPFVSRVLPSVLALPLNTSAVGHYRVTQPFSELERLGWIQGKLNYGAPGVIDLEREKPDVVVVQYRYTTRTVEELERIRRFSNARWVYELDDYILDVPKNNAHARNMPSNMRELVARALDLCDRVVVSTQPLADALAGMHDDIRVVPNMLAASLWRGLRSRRQTSVRPRVGWAGGTSHRGDLELIADVVKALADKVDWVFFGMCPDVLRPYIKEFHKGVALSLYPQKLASLDLDLALAPLEINLFNDCKSNLRLLEYGACGFPVICTDTKAYQGYLPCTRVVTNSTEEWLEAIHTHLADPAASYRQGDALREAVLRDYVLTEQNLQHWASGWLAD